MLIAIAKLWGRSCCFMVSTLLIIAIFAGCGGSSSPASGQQSAPPVYRLHGLSFSPYMDGQSPNLGTQIPESQLRSRITLVAPYTNWIRTFGVTAGLEKTGAIAHSMNLKVAAGAWIGKDSSANEAEIANLIAVGKSGEADLLIVGSEVLLRGDKTEAELINYIRRVKQAVPGLPVATADVYSVILDHPAIVAEIDTVMVNYYPYWEGIRVDQALAAIHGWHQQIKELAGSKSVIVSETGWPSGGNTVGNAVPSQENAAAYFLNFVSWAKANSVQYFYFEGFDESWKSSSEGPQGAHWGIWDKDGVMKAGMEAVFAGSTMADNWSGIAIPGGPGSPALQFTQIPARGSFSDLTGQVWHVKPADYAIAVYIYVSGGWWTKPTFSSPLTTIRVDGSWTCDITTGGIDQNATKIAAYLLPKGYSPPLASDSASLPVELAANSVARLEVSR